VPICYIKITAHKQVGHFSIFRDKTE